MDRHELTLHHSHRDVTILCGTRRAAISARLVRAYLPAALLASSSSPTPLLNRRNQLDLDDHIAGSAPVRAGMLRPAKMQRICQEFVDILADASDGSGISNGTTAAADAVSAALMDALARAQLEDRRTAGRVEYTAGHRGGGGVRHPRTLSTFIALADLSRTFGSRRLGAVLSSFFARHGERIVGTCADPFSDDDYDDGDGEGADLGLEGYDRYDRYGGGGGGGRGDDGLEHPHAVLLWAWSLAVARMASGDADRRACLRDLLRARPDVLLSGRYDGFTAAALPDGDAEELWTAVERAMEREGERRGGGGGLWPPLGWQQQQQQQQQQQRRGFEGFFEGRGRKREMERNLQERRRAAAGGGGVYMHEHRERRVVRSSGLDGGDRRPPPLGLETYYHCAHRHIDPLDDRINAWKHRPRGYGVGVGVVGGAAGRLRGTLDSIRTDQRELRLDVHDVKDELDELVEKVNKLGRRDGTRWRKGRADRDMADCCCERGLPEEHESEWVSEWWDDSY